MPSTLSARGFIALLLAAVIVSAGSLALGVAIGRPHGASSGTQPITVAWKRSISKPVGFAMASGGRFFAVVDRDGNVRFLDASGNTIWSTRVEGATSVLIAKNGQSLLIFSKLNPLFTDVYFYKGDGRLLWKHHVDGTIWCGAVSPDGARAAVTTSKKYIYVYKPDPRHPKFHRWLLDGIGHSATFTPDNQDVVIGTWQKPELVCFTIDGDLQWKTKHDSENQYQIQVSADGHSILGTLPGAPESPKIQMCLWNSSGSLMWKQDIVGFDGRALVSPQSQYAAISFARKVSANSKMLERKVAVYKASGDLWWEKGGLFFGPRLVALSPTGSSVIVSDGDRHLYNIDKSGRILSKLALSAALQDEMSSDDGRIILAYCSDGSLSLIAVGP
jgi:WD40 repeat protein